MEQHGKNLAGSHQLSPGRVPDLLLARLAEGEVARLEIRLAHKGADRKGGEDRTAHVGFYLIDQGSAELDRLAEVRWSPSEALRK
jgi:cyclic beta-1,2-glucan synthetase